MTEDDEPAERVERRGSISELAIVFGLTAALPLALTLASDQTESLDFSQAQLLGTIAVEAVVVALLWPWLARRGWALRRIAGVPEPMDILRGIGVALLAWLAYYVNAIAWVIFVPGSSAAMTSSVPTGTAAPWAIILVSIVNPVVEEFLWLAYGVTALSRYGIRLAIVASIAFRMAVHAYQGMMAFIGILPLAIVFTVYYARTRRVWPVVVAHMLFDTLSLAVLRE